MWPCDWHMRIASSSLTCALIKQSLSTFACKMVMRLAFELYEARLTCLFILILMIDLTASTCSGESWLCASRITGSHADIKVSCSWTKVCTRICRNNQYWTCHEDLVMRIIPMQFAGPDGRVVNCNISVLNLHMKTGSIQCISWHLPNTAMQT